MTDRITPYKTAAEYIREQIKGQTPLVGVVLGSGLGSLADKIENPTVIPYKQIPGFPESTAIGHKGNLIFGDLAGKKVIAMQGRFHYYEGYTMQQVTFPIRVMKLLGISYLFVSNAAGGMNPDFKIGDIMIINDHINLFPENPLRGKNYNELGPRFPEMSEPYSHRLIADALKVADEAGIKVHQGVYVGTQGPTFETPAEYRYFRRIGGDAVGMSTVPEVIVARHAGIEVFAISVITDLGGLEGVEPEKVSHEEVQLAAAAAQPKMTAIMTGLINEFKE